MVFMRGLQLVWAVRNAVAQWKRRGINGLPAWSLRTRQERRCKHTTFFLLLLLFFFFFSPSVVKIPRVKSSKKLKSKAGVARHLNRPWTHGQRKSLETERSWSVVWWLQYAGRDRTLPVNPSRPGWFCGHNPGKGNCRSFIEPRVSLQSDRLEMAPKGKICVFGALPGRCYYCYYYYYLFMNSQL